MPEDTIYRARSLPKCPELEKEGVDWHNDPYHEYLVFGPVPADTIVGSVKLHSVTNEINRLLPGFDLLDCRDGLHEGLARFELWTDFCAIVDGHEDDISAAMLLAEKLVHSDREAQFQITMMFLTLRERNYDSIWG